MFAEILNIQIFSLVLVFVRISTALFLFPGFSSAFIFPRFRLFVSLALSVIVTGLVGDQLPPMPASIMELFLLLFKELVIGAFLGMFPQFIMVALDFAGSMMGHGVGFSNAQSFDPTTSATSTVISSFLSFLAFTLVVVLDLHHLMLLGVFDSYTLFVPGLELPWGDFSNFFGMYLAKGFRIGFQISAPFFLLSILFNVGTGVISRLMPQLQVIFVMMPLQIYLGISLLFIALPICMSLYMRYYEESLMVLIR